MTAEQGIQDMSLQPDMLVGNYADIDLHRHIRQGMPEVIYGEGKTAEQILGIAAAMKKKDIGNIMITRLSKEKAEKISSELELDYREICRIGIVNPQDRGGKDCTCRRRDERSAGGRGSGSHGGAVWQSCSAGL
ncbi:MAG: hypothetical protein ACLU3N_04400 [Lachnospiraceae bacterium]